MRVLLLQAVLQVGGIGPGNQVGAHSSPAGLLNELSHPICKFIPACLLQRGATGKCPGAVCLGVGLVGDLARSCSGGAYAPWGERSWYNFQRRNNIEII